MDVRPAADEDLPAIAKIATANDEHAGTDPRYVSPLRNNGRFLVAEVDGVLAGYCGTRRTAEATMLTDLFVDPDRQSGGGRRRPPGGARDGAGGSPTFAPPAPRAVSLFRPPRVGSRRPPLFPSRAPPP